MMIRLNRFNTYLCLGLVLAGAGCETTAPDKAATPSKKPSSKEQSTLRLHLETNRDGTKHNETIQVLRDNPTAMTVEKNPFLSEAGIESAKLIETMGVFSIQVQFDRPGMWQLEQYTTANKGRHIAIFSQFGETAAECRWLAAPLITQRIATGSLIFSPDASREEADRIVRGLNNVVAKRKKQGL